MSVVLRTGTSVSVSVVLNAWYLGLVLGPFLRRHPGSEFGLVSL